MADQQLEWGWKRVQRPEPAPLPASRVRPRVAKKSAAPVVASSGAALEEGLRELESCIDEIGNGRIGPIQSDRLHITVPMRGSDDELYYLRITTSDYPARASSCTFVDADGASTEGAWPGYDTSGPFRPPVFICTPPTAEFYEYHQERRYDPRDGTLVNLVCTIFTALNGRGYKGRFKKRTRVWRGRAR